MGAPSSQGQAPPGKESPASLPHPLPGSTSAPISLLRYLHGVVQLLGLVSVWRVHQSHDEPLKFATELRLQGLGEILMQEQGRVMTCPLHPCVCRQQVGGGAQQLWLDGHMSCHMLVLPGVSWASNVASLDIIPLTCEVRIVVLLCHTTA